MKVNEVLKKTTERTELFTKEGVNKRQLKQSTFNEELTKMKGLATKERLNLLLERIDKQAERFSKNVDIKELLAYKKLVSEFLKEVVDSMVKFSKENFLDRRGRHRIYAIIKKVDREMEELTEEVLKKEKDNLKILKKLDDIRGLILDIYM